MITSTEETTMLDEMMVTDHETAIRRQEAANTTSTDAVGPTVHGITILSVAKNDGHQIGAIEKMKVTATRGAVDGARPTLLCRARARAVAAVAVAEVALARREPMESVRLLVMSVRNDKMH